MSDSVLAPVEPDPAALRDRFFADARHWSLGLLRGRRWRLTFGPFTVLSFGEPQPSPGGWSWQIQGGWLASEPGGRLSIRCGDGRLTATVEGYRPLLPAPLYGLLQVPLHHLTTRLFLLRLRGRTPAPGPAAPLQRRALASAIDAAACLLLGRLRPRRVLAVAGIYHVAFWSLTGQTPGERAAGIRLLALDGSRPTPAQAAVRLLAGDGLAATEMIEARGLSA